MFVFAILVRTACCFCCWTFGENEKSKHEDYDHDFKVTHLMLDFPLSGVQAVHSAAVLVIDCLEHGVDLPQLVPLPAHLLLLVAQQFPQLVDLGGQVPKVPLVLELVQEAVEAVAEVVTALPVGLHALSQPRLRIFHIVR